MKPTEEKTHSNPSDLPVYLFKQGNNCEAYRYFGAHIEQRAGETGVVFRVWAPHATAISVVGDFNSWKPGSHPMRKVDGDSVWELFIPGMKEYDVYKYCVTTRAGDLVYKADPYAFHAETRPSNGSKVYDLNGFVWHDDGVAERPEEGGCHQRADEHLRDARRQLEDEGGRSALQLLRAGRRADPVYHRDGLHPRRAAARHGVSLRRQLGLSGDRLLSPPPAATAPRRT